MFYETGDAFLNSAFKQTGSKTKKDQHVDVTFKADDDKIKLTYVTMIVYQVKYSKFVIKFN